MQLFVNEFFVDFQMVMPISFTDYLTVQDTDLSLKQYFSPLFKNKFDIL
jgi:hypothetical protein